MEILMAVVFLKSWEKKPDFSGSRNQWKNRESRVAGSWGVLFMRSTNEIQRG